MANAPQLMGEAMKPMNMLDTVRPTPTKKLAHTAPLEMRELYKPQISGPRNAPARAPQEILIS